MKGHSLTSSTADVPEPIRSNVVEQFHHIFEPFVHFEIGREASGYVSAKSKADHEC
jgi:hypothetical protein